MSGCAQSAVSVGDRDAYKLAFKTGYQDVCRIAYNFDPNPSGKLVGNDGITRSESDCYNSMPTIPSIPADFVEIGPNTATAEGCTDGANTAVSVVWPRGVWEVCILGEPDNCIEPEDSSWFDLTCL